MAARFVQLMRHLKISNLGRLSMIRRLCIDQEDKHTALYDFHVINGGKMVSFADWSLPVQYGDHSITDSSIHTRQKASIFDVSHMLQLKIHGDDAEAFLEFILVADLAKLTIGSGCLSVFTTSKGGILDDCIVTRIAPSSFYIVSNAGRANVVLHHIQEQLNSFHGGHSVVSATTMLRKSLIALQGPISASILQTGVDKDLSSLKFMNSAVMKTFDIPSCRVTRCGYTGEDGFEISVPTESVVSLTEKLLNVQKGSVKLAGLGARDVLRLEAGLCLYGNDISESTTPIRAGLAWCISERRRRQGGFLGADVILAELKNKPSIRRVGLLLGHGAPARSGYPIFNGDGETVGKITSGTPSPTLKTNIAMGYVNDGLHKAGTKLQVQIRSKCVNATVTKMPFVPSNYYK